MNLLDKIKTTVRDVPDFPKEGILFKDITPILSDINLFNEIVMEFANRYRGLNFDAVAGIESRGFWFGVALASELGLPFIPIRKKGKLPFKKISEEFDLEYGTDQLEIHQDAVVEGWNVLIHDDLLATGGTALAAKKLIEKIGGEVKMYSFLIELSFLKGEEKLTNKGVQVDQIVRY